MRRLLVVCSCLAALGCSTTDSRNAGFVPIFNGIDLGGWEIQNRGRFSVRDELLVVDRGTGWLRSTQQYGDFILRLRFRFVEPGANSGIFVRTGASSKSDENGWPDNGYQVQCLDALDGRRPLATIIPYGGPEFTDEHHESDLEAIREAYRPDGEWNAYEIRCIEDRIEVWLNGVRVTRAWNIRNRRGYIGIQAEHGRLEFRSISVRSLDEPPGER